jgi:hypothetical protein
MAVSLLGPLNKVINDTTTQIVDNEIPTKVSQVVTTLVSSSFGVVDDLLKQVQDLTKEETKTTPKSKSKKSNP